MGSDEGLRGFEVPDGEVPAPATDLDEATRQQCIRAVAAMICGHTPEKIMASVRADEWPVDVREQLEREWEPEELSAYVDVLLCIQEGGVFA